MVGLGQAIFFNGMRCQCLMKLIGELDTELVEIPESIFKKGLKFDKMNKDELFDKYWDSADLTYMEFENSVSRDNYPNRAYWHYKIKDLGETIYHTNSETPIEYLNEINKYTSPNNSIKITKLKSIEDAQKLWSKMKTWNLAINNNKHIYIAPIKGGG